MKQIKIEGGHVLSGTINISGAKNSANNKLNAKRGNNSLIDFKIFFI